MSVPQSILEALQANSALVALVSTRIFATVAPLGTTDAFGPWVVFERISNTQGAAHDGDAHLGRSRYQFSVGSSDKATVDQVRDVLLTLNGTSFTAASTQTITFFHAGDHEHYDSALRTYSAMVDFYIWANT